jgi:addiction module HigA family antidote
MARTLGPIPMPHPGEILLLEFMEPMGITRYQLAKDLHVNGQRVYNLIKGEYAITADMALRLSRYFGTSPQFWMNLQSAYDLRTAQAAGGDYDSIQERPEVEAARIAAREEEQAMAPMRLAA